MVFSMTSQENFLDWCKMLMSEARKGEIISHMLEMEIQYLLVL